MGKQDWRTGDVNLLDKAIQRLVDRQNQIHAEARAWKTVGRHKESSEAKLVAKGVALSIKTLQRLRMKVEQPVIKAEG